MPCEAREPVSRSGPRRPFCLLRDFEDLNVTQERCVECESVGVAGYFTRAGWEAVADERIDEDNQGVRDRAFAGERHQIWICGEAAIPIGNAIDLDGPM